MLVVSREEPNEQKAEKITLRTIIIDLKNKKLKEAFRFFQISLHKCVLTARVSPIF